ncbi:hypothetical protein PR048_027751 [Dryococelus australis]|uniref:Uncharacterized protein n=1 Tax=Dryococelus australis TaxID=614101 RepID=A0ABQ9GHE9_9NEOP|nr:hypothetical protein PR048_027751 [Dryococelus australis]
MHVIIEKRVRLALGKQSRTATVAKYDRGRKSRETRLQKQHIQSLITDYSHYSRAKSPFRKCMPPGPWLKGAHHAYQECQNVTYPE